MNKTQTIGVLSLALLVIGCDPGYNKVDNNVTAVDNTSRVAPVTLQQRVEADVQRSDVWPIVHYIELDRAYLPDRSVVFDLGEDYRLGVHTFAPVGDTTTVLLTKSGSKVFADRPIIVRYLPDGTVVDAYICPDGCCCTGTPRPLDGWTMGIDLSCVVKIIRSYQKCIDDCKQPPDWICKGICAGFAAAVDCGTTRKPAPAME